MNILVLYATNITSSVPANIELSILRGHPYSICYQTDYGTSFIVLGWCNIVRSTTSILSSAAETLWRHWDIRSNSNHVLGKWADYSLDYNQFDCDVWHPPTAARHCYSFHRPRMYGRRPYGNVTTVGLPRRQWARTLIPGQARSRKTSTSCCWLRSRL